MACGARGKGRCRCAYRMTNKSGHTASFNTQLHAQIGENYRFECRKPVKRQICIVTPSLRRLKPKTPHSSETYMHRYSSPGKPTS